MRATQKRRHRSLVARRDRRRTMRRRVRRPPVPKHGAPDNKEKTCTSPGRSASPRWPSSQAGVAMKSLQPALAQTAATARAAGRAGDRRQRSSTGKRSVRSCPTPSCAPRRWSSPTRRRSPCSRATCGKHFHAGNEEIQYILSGTGTMWLGDKPGVDQAGRPRRHPQGHASRRHGADVGHVQGHRDQDPAAGRGRHALRPVGRRPPPIDGGGRDR